MATQAELDQIKTRMGLSPSKSDENPDPTPANDPGVTNPAPVDEPETVIPEPEPVVVPVQDNPTPTPTPAAAEPLTPELSEEQLLELLNQRTGLNVKSFADLKPAEVPEVEPTAEELENEKLAFALQKGLIKTKDYEGYVRDSSNTQDLVWRQFLASAKKEDPTASDEDLQAEFDEIYGISLDKNSRKYKSGQTLLSVVADRILKDTYKSIYEIDDKFNAHRSSEKVARENQKRLEKELPQYTATLKSMFTKEMKTIPYEIDGTTYDIAVPKNIIDQTIATLSAPAFANEQVIKEAWKNGGIQGTVEGFLLAAHKNYFASEAAKKYHLAKQAGVRGVPTPANQPAPAAPSKLTADQQKVYDARKKAGLIPSAN